MPTVPAGRAEVVTDKAGGFTLTVRAAVDDADALSVTFTVKLLDPTTLGVPEMVPPAERLKPAGIDPLETAQE